MGFWHLRNTPQRDEVACEGDAWGLQCGLDLLLARLAALGGGARARLLWRGYSLLEMREGRYFHSDVVHAHDALAAAKWARAGYAVVPMAHLTPPSDGGDGNWTFTVDGYHPERYIYRQHLREVLQVGLGMMEAAGGVAAGGDEAGSAAGAATAGQAMPQPPVSVAPASVASSSESFSEGSTEGPFEHPPAAANPSESSVQPFASSSLALTDTPSDPAQSSIDERAHAALVARADVATAHRGVSDELEWAPHTYTTSGFAGPVARPLRAPTALFEQLAPASALALLLLLAWVVVARRRSRLALLPLSTP